MAASTYFTAEYSALKKRAKHTRCHAAINMGITLIIEGIDRVGKDTLVKTLRESQPTETWLHLHNGAPPRVLTSPHEAVDWETRQFWRSFTTAEFVDCNIAINRAHLSAYAYGTVFRGYNRLQQKALMATERLLSLDKTYLLLLTIDPHIAFARNDNNSAINTVIKANTTQGLLLHALTLSRIKNRLSIDVTKLTPQKIGNIIIDWTTYKNGNMR